MVETPSLTLREERRFRVFENQILRRIFEPKRDANGEWRRLHNKERHSLHCLSNRMIKSQRLSWARHIARIEEGRSAFKILTATGKRPIEMSRLRWEANIRMGCKEIGLIRGIGFIRLRIGIIGEPL